jgi:hypothetical protein
LAEYLLHGEAALGGELLERNALTWETPELLTRSSDDLAVLLSQRFVIGFDHDFKQLADGCDLIGAELLNQLVDVLPGFGITYGHFGYAFSYILAPYPVAGSPYTGWS